MKRTELIEIVCNCKTPIPYDKSDLVDRIATKRPISTGQNRLLCQMINDASKAECNAVEVKTEHWSDEYLFINFDTKGKSLQELGPLLKPVVKHNQSIPPITHKNNATIVTHEKGNLKRPDITGIFTPTAEAGKVEGVSAESTESLRAERYGNGF